MPASPRPSALHRDSLDRRAAERDDADWFATALADPDTLFLPMRALLPLVERAPAAAVRFLQSGDPLLESLTAERCVLLGWFRGRRSVVVALDEDGPAPPSGSFEELRPLLGDLPADEASLLYGARALLHWRAKHRCCGVCGAPRGRAPPGMRCAARIRSAPPISSRASTRP